MLHIERSGAWQGPEARCKARVPQIALARSRFSRYIKPFARLLIYLLALERNNTSTLHGAPLPVNLGCLQPPCNGRKRVFLHREFIAYDPFLSSFLSLVCSRSSCSVDRKQHLCCDTVRLLLLEPCFLRRDLRNGYAKKIYEIEITYRGILK